MQIFEEFLEDLKKIDPIQEKYSLGISVDRELYFYVFTRYLSHQSQILLMKEFILLHLVVEFLPKQMCNLF